MRRTSSAGTVAAPVEANRRLDTSVVADVGVRQHQRPLRRHALGDGDALALDEPQRVGRLPRRGGDDGGDRVLELVPHPGHVGDVGERQRREPAIGERAERARTRAMAAQAVVVEHRALGQPVVPLVHTIATGSDGVERRPARRRVEPRRSTPRCRRSSVITTRRPGLLEDARHLAAARAEG